jgi:hypothetical protein
MEIFQTFVFTTCLLYNGFFSVIWSTKNALNTVIKVFSTMIFLLGVPGLIGILKTSNFDYLYHFNIIYPATIATFFVFTRGNDTLALIFRSISLAVVGLAVAYFFVL